MRFSRYELIHQIYSSTRGELWLAEQLGAEGFTRKVVIARLDPDNSSNPRRVEAFINSTRSAATIDHAHVARVFDIGCEDGVFYYCRSWVDGMSARQLLGKLAPLAKSLPLRHALFITRQVADAVVAAHRANKVHGALSASRVMISRYGEVVVTGFTGEALFDDRGGPAPETEIDERSDVFAIGALLYELIAGVSATAAGERPRLSRIAAEISPELDRAVERALSVDPADRQQDVAGLLEELREISEPLAKSSAHALGNWITDALADREPEKPTRPVVKFPAIPPTQVKPLAETRRPRRIARGSEAPPPDPASYARIPVVVRQRETTARIKRPSKTRRQTLIILAIAALLFAASTTITMALH